MSLKSKWRAECVGVGWHCALNCLHQMVFQSVHICFVSYLTSAPLFPLVLIFTPLLCSESLLLAYGHALSEDTWLCKWKYFPNISYKSDCRCRLRCRSFFPNQKIKKKTDLLGPLGSKTSWTRNADTLTPCNVNMTYICVSKQWLIYTSSRWIIPSYVCVTWGMYVQYSLSFSFVLVYTHPWEKYLAL